MWQSFNSCVNCLDGMWSHCCRRQGSTETRRSRESAPLRRTPYCPFQQSARPLPYLTACAGHGVIRKDSPQFTCATHTNTRTPRHRHVPLSRLHNVHRWTAGYTPSEALRHRGCYCTAAIAHIYLRTGPWTAPLLVHRSSRHRWRSCLRHRHQRQRSPPSRLHRLCDCRTPGRRR